MGTFRWVCLAVLGVGCGDVAVHPVTCTDGVRNGMETDIDCGGACAACPGGACMNGTECASGLCDNQVCVQCIEASDCGGVIPNPAGCNLDACQANVCMATPRHDNTTFQVSPLFTAETNLSNGVAFTRKVVWDGTNFLVVYGNGAGWNAKRVAPDGTILDATPFLLDVRFGDIARGPNGYIVATVEPMNGTYPAQHFAVHTINDAGAVTVAKQVALYDPGTNCGTGTTSDLMGPQLASFGGNYILSGHVCGVVRAVFSTGAPAFSYDVQLNIARQEHVAAGAAGFAVLTEENRIGMGGNEAYVQTFGPTGTATSTYSNKHPYSDPNQCCVTNLGIVAGTSSFLLASTRAENQDIRYQALSATGALVGAPVTILGSFSRYDSPVMAFDGSNYLVNTRLAAASLPAYRFSQTGEVLDAVPIQLTPDDAAIESAATLASDGAGRFLVAYKKSTDDNVYIRTFSTCP